MKSPSDHFASAALAAGCPLDQMQNFVRAGVVLQPRQLAASAASRLCDRPDGPTAIGFGGARGGGKSYWLVAQLGVDDCQRYPHLKCLLLRKVGKSNVEHFEDLRRRLFPRLPHKWNTTDAKLTFANGSSIRAGHYQCEKDIDQYLGLEYDIIGIEEATTLTSRKYHDLITINRTSRPGWRPRVYSTTNPGGVGHAWYRATYVIPFQQGRETDTRFISATVDDNPFTNVEYRRTLDRLTGWQRRAWLHGDWDIAAGQFFTNFRRDIHVVDHFNVHQNVEWFAALDYGFNHYTVVLLGCRDSDGNTCVMDEHSARGWVPERHAEAIKKMLERHRVRLQPVTKYSIALQRFVAGPDVFARNSEGTTIADQYKKLGINLRPASADRINGWAAVLHGLGDSVAGVRPTLFFHKNCARLIDCLPTLQHDPGRPEDVLKIDTDEDGIGGDDAADALRYLVATRGRYITQKKLSGF